MADQPEPESASLTRSIISAGQLTRERLSSFGVLYVAVFVFLVLYVFTIQLVENVLDQRLQEVANEAVYVTQLDRPIAIQIQDRMHAAIELSPWVTLGGVRVATVVLGNDGITWIYVDGRVMPQPQGLEPRDVLNEAVQLLPVTVDITVSVPHNTLLANGSLIGYAAVLLQSLYLYNRANSRRENRRLELALAARDIAAQRAAEIEAEVQATRLRLMQLEPAERMHNEEIASLESERRSLQSKLNALAAREEELRGQANHATDLAQEVHALEDLLDEAGNDLSHKDDEIRNLERSLKHASKGSKTGGGKAGGRARGAENLARRLRTLYKNLDVDDRAIDDLIALRDESMKLKAEEKLKRLCEEADNVAVRRKVGGLPDHLSVFELGFAGKGRIYYSRAKQGRFRVMVVGAKNTQDADLDYMRGLGKDMAGDA